MNASGSAQHTSGQNGWGTVSVTGAENLTMGAADPRHSTADGAAPRGDEPMLYLVRRAAAHAGRTVVVSLLSPWVPRHDGRSVQSRPVGTPQCSHLLPLPLPAHGATHGAVHYDPKEPSLGARAGYASAIPGSGGSIPSALANTMR